MMKIITSLCCYFLAMSAYAQPEYKFYNVTGPGNSADVIGRCVSDQYAKQTKKLLPVINKPGGDQIIAVNALKSDPNGVLFGGAATHVYNYILRPTGVPYTDKDFDFVGVSGYLAFVWYVSGQSDIKTMKQLVKTMEQSTNFNVGGDNASGYVNIESLIKNKKLQSRVALVRFKSANETMTNVVGGHINAAVSAVTPNLLAQHNDGSIRILGNTMDRTIQVSGNIEIPSVSKELGILQFAGANIISISPHFPAKEAAQLKNEIRAAFRTAECVKLMTDNGMIPGELETSHAQQWITRNRNEVGQVLNSK
jgi:tripartite-type tricarboxylate transporter receptor subunit TctC